MLYLRSVLASRISWSAIGRWLPSRGSVLFTLLILGLFVFAGRAGALPGVQLSTPNAASTNLIAYQGRLTDAAGVPPPDVQSYDMTFRLYAVPDGGTELWSESQAVPTTDGVFSVMLGTVTPIPASVAANSNLYLGVTVGNDAEMTPRKQLGSVAYVFQALTVADGAITDAKIVDGAVTSAKLADGSVSRPKIANGAVNQTKAPSLVRSLNGDYVKIQTGTSEAQSTGSQWVDFVVTFPAAFTNIPVITVSNCTDSGSLSWFGDALAVYGESRSSTGFRALLHLGEPSNGETYRLCWTAVGP